MTLALRNLKLAPRQAPELNRTTADNGEIYYDITSGTLRLYNGKAFGGTLIATQNYVTGQGYITSTALAGVATQNYVTTRGYITSAALTGLTTQGYVDTAISTAISNLVDGAPGALNTLNELAAAINDDASYASSITTLLGNKAPLASPTFTGTATFGNTTDVITPRTFDTTIVFNAALGSVFSVATPSANFIANFSNIPTTDYRATAFTIIIEQGSTAYIPNAVQIDGSGYSVKWQGGTPPAGDANKTNFFSFVLLRIQGAWSVTGSASTFG